MQNTPEIVRQGIGCGYAPPVDGARPWDNPARDPEQRSSPTTCPGYATALPEVRETSYARLHWKQSQLEAWARGAPTEQQLDAIAILEASTQALESWLLTPRDKGGGGA